MVPHDLLERDLLVLVSSHEGLGDGVLVEEVNVGFVGVTAHDGSQVLPAFTDERTLGRWAAPGAPFVGMDARTVLALFSDEGMPWERLVVDTGSDAAFSLTVDQARRLLEAN